MYKHVILMDWKTKHCKERFMNVGTNDILV